MLTKAPLSMWAIAEAMHKVRQEDRDEFCALTGKPWEAARDSMLRAMMDPTGVHSALWDETDELVAVGGFSLNGMCWFLCTPQVGLHVREFCKEIMLNRDQVHSTGAVCHNVVDLGNDLHVRFLKWLGAEFSREVFTKGGRQFARFYIPPPTGESDV